mgnify:CR=1 FL=1
MTPIMVRRTKEDALATRHSLLDAAERVFQAKGVSATSLNDIANQAGTTRGAIYWHFKDKADLFNAMMDRVTLPMEDALNKPAAPEAGDPLPAMRAALLHALHRTATDEQTRRVFEVATQKVEYVDALCAVRGRHLEVRSDCLASMQKTLKQSARHRGQRLALPSEVAARGLHALVDGLISNWLLDPTAFDLRSCGQRSIDAYLSGLGLPATA